MRKNIKSKDVLLMNMLKKIGIFHKAYRYLISAKVIDQLEEFEIQPCYERLCRTMYNYAKTPEQMKLLWKTMLSKFGDRPDCINTYHISKVWKELITNEKYNKICHYEDDIMKYVENSLIKYSNPMRYQPTNNTKNINNNINNSIHNNENNKMMNNINNNFINNITNNNINIFSYQTNSITNQFNNVNNQINIDNNQINKINFNNQITNPKLHILHPI
ncbi:hypothetical protein LY90DRAFT_506274 [Neocallimastix californiae]|uniref:Uncharacterized protein n=1 Tax=Neocallimastix californiae TaxID=1754190 RepID=A0A1Y2DG55_9FUNG|nr:hypothetical protein LY90DRAFT_506274 [Neocallimastix californiae]|eukprot:ORY58283.1 hypothetical protein LY90DRAFT_506274 [Neocallimastix californiae]